MIRLGCVILAILLLPPAAHAEVLDKEPHPILFWAVPAAMSSLVVLLTL